MGEITMAQKKRIIEHLEMMGYKVVEDGDVILVSLKTSTGHLFGYSTSEAELVHRDFVIEKIVFSINKQITNKF
jgi:hypothetical protein